MNLKGAIKGKINHIIRNLSFIKVKNSIDKTTTRTVICNNCVGAMVLHDYGLAFNSPFVNLFIEPHDYLLLLNDLEYYCSPNADIQDISDNLGSDYPIGLLNGKIKLHFLHYDNFEKAVSIWRKRCLRIDFKKLYVIFVQQSGCTDEMIQLFSKLPFPNKIVFVNKDKNSEFQFIISGFENKKTLGLITAYTGWNGRRYYDDYDWKQFLHLIPTI